MAITITITPKAVLGLLAIIGIAVVLWNMWRTPDDDFSALLFGGEDEGDGR